jgi:hypothetical protein
MRTFRFLMLCGFLCGGFAVKGQNLNQGMGQNSGNNVQTDSLDIDERELFLGRFKAENFWFDTILTTQPDTALLGAQWYDPSLRNLEHWQTAGILGGFARPLTFEPPKFSPISLGFRQYALYDREFTPDDQWLWKVNKPLTIAEYLTGATVQQHFGILHTQKIGEAFYIGAEYRQLSSDGFYFNQATSNRSLRVFAHFKTPGNRYAAHIGYFRHNRIDEQNGGIALGTLFDTTVSFNPLSVPVNLRSANSRHSHQTFSVTQYYRLSGADSSFTGHSLFHDFRLNREYYRYNDPDVARGFTYYPAVLRDSTATFDSTAFVQMHNAFGIRSENPFSNWQYSLSVFAENGRVDLGWQPQQFWLWGTKGRLLFRKNNHQQEIQGIWSPYSSLQAGSYQIQYQGSQRWGVVKLHWQAGSRLQNPDLISEQLQTNHYRWQQRFKGIGVQEFRLGLTLPLFWGEIGYNSWQNPLFYAANGQPFQDGNGFDQFQLRYGSHIKWWKLHLQVNHLLQQSNDTRVRLPRFSTHDLLYFEHRFQAGWQLQIGVVFRYHSAFAAYAFRPETGQFVIQDSLQIGNYPVLDAFAAIKVKRTRLFARFEHANQGFPRPNVFTTPLYPLYGRAFRFGVSWAFYN